MPAEGNREQCGFKDAISLWSQKLDHRDRAKGMHPQEREVFADASVGLASLSVSARRRLCV